MSMRAADERDIVGVGQFDVGDELATAVQMARVLLAQQRRADTEARLGGSVHLFHRSIHRSRRGGNGGDDIGVAGTAADVAGKLVADVLR
jgi:hypothetical protein